MNYSPLEKMTVKINQVLHKAGTQFNERHHSIQQGYIEDLRQFCKVVTICEEQLILNLMEYDLAFLGELVKTISGFHLIILNNLLLWIQQYELHLTPNPRKVPFECLIEQSIKQRDKVIKLNQSRASLEMVSIGDFMQKLSMNNKSLIDSHPSPQEVPQGHQVIEQETLKIREAIKNNGVLKKLLHLKKEKRDLQVQTNMTCYDIRFIVDQNEELKELLKTTSQNYENKLKAEILKYHDAKLILKAQKTELDHKDALLETQNIELNKHKHKRQVNSLIKKFIKIPTIAEKNKRFSISYEKNNRSVLFSNQKIRSNSLPRIESSFENSKKIDYQIIKNIMPSHDSRELMQRMMNPVEQAKFLKACHYVGLQVPTKLFEEQDGSPKHNEFNKLLAQLKIRHQQCMPKCDHISFLQ